MARQITVLIAEDHHVVREGLRVLIDSDPALQIVGEAKDGDQAVALARQLHPDVVVMDLVMPRSNGFEATTAICREAPATRVLVLSAYYDDETMLRVLETGATGYITKHAAAEEVLTAIHEVARGNSYYGSLVAHRMRVRQRQIPLLGRGGPVVLTSRERQVLACVARGQPNKQIAFDLDLSIKTVEKHRQAVMDKIGIHDIAGLTRYALDRGLLSAIPLSMTAFSALQTVRPRPSIS